ncbi:S-layer homology domain-containing protein [Bacillus sp. Bva_UNVM-123]|uniref:YcdB/YcdC domain-containing protein n=1 Tax=Bacillus sp. Bva_UNVM-123 TaxID=2829798 RepID=UPI00391F425A
MRNLRNLGILTLSTSLSIGIFAPGVDATSVVNESNKNVQIQIAQSEKLVSKSELIKKFKAFFPQFKFLNDSDFNIENGHRYPNDDSIRYDLSFHKNENGKQIYGNVGFVGEQLEIERFFYQPANAKDALFPAKVTKDKAKETAQAFLKKFPESSEYQLVNDGFDYFSGNQIPTEPIRYSFSFVRIKNKVPVSDDQIQIGVLGNGEIIYFSRHSSSNGSPSYDDVTKVLPKNEMMSKMKENLTFDLYYSINYDFQTDDRDVKLVYQPTSDVIGIHAISGEWQTINGFSPEFPKEKVIERITTQPIQPNKTNFSLEEAKALAEKLLAIDSKEYKLKINSIEERKNHNGQEIISIQYMYEYRNGGTGTSLELDKRTGEIIQYHDLKSELLKESAESKKTSQPISSKDALNQAVKYLKQYSPSYLHNYALPTHETYLDEDREVYHFSFPRVVNGILVIGDLLSVSVSADGSLIGLNVNQSDIQNWPSAEKVISKENAKAKFFEQLTLELNYVKERFDKKNNHYQLVYTPKFSKNPFSFLNAKTGEWNSIINNNQQAVSHPWAEKELNYLIQAGIINVKDAKTFDANKKVTKGEALEMIIKSLTRFYREYDPNQKNNNQSFDNIKPDHPLYQVIERAVTLGVLDKKGGTFNLNESLTKEELAVWYIRILGLEQAAKNQGIYQLKFADAKDVKAENVGFVALAHSLDLLKTSDNKFSPKKEVTYADLAVSAIPLAHEVYEKGIQINY